MKHFLILLAVLASGCAKVQWEYSIKAPHDSAIESTMNGMGEDGWELVETRRVLTGNDFIDKARTEMIFKRRK